MLKTVQIKAQGRHEKVVEVREILVWTPNISCAPFLSDFFLFGIPNPLVSYLNEAAQHLALLKFSKEQLDARRWAGAFNTSRNRHNARKQQVTATLRRGTVGIREKILADNINSSNKFQRPFMFALYSEGLNKAAQIKAAFCRGASPVKRYKFVNLTGGCYE